MEIISKELVKEVLGIYKEIDTLYFDKETNEIIFTTYADITQGVRSYDVNIHELAHLHCKTWALEKHGISLTSFIDYGNNCFCELYDPKKDQKIKFHKNTEPAAIFKACQWKLENE